MPVLPVRILNVLLIALLTAAGFFSLAFGAEPARRAAPVLWTVLPFAVALAGLAYAAATWKMRPQASWATFVALLLCAVLLLVWQRSPH